MIDFNVWYEKRINEWLNDGGQKEQEDKQNWLFRYFARIGVAQQIESYRLQDSQDPLRAFLYAYPERKTFIANMKTAWRGYKNDVRKKSGGLRKVQLYLSGSTMDKLVHLVGEHGLTLSELVDLQLSNALLNLLDKKELVKRQQREEKAQQKMQEQNLKQQIKNENRRYDNIHKPAAELHKQNQKLREQITQLKTEIEAERKIVEDQKSEIMAMANAIAEVDSIDDNRIKLSEEAHSKLEELAKNEGKSISQYLEDLIA